MDAFTVVKEYVDRMLPADNSMKVLLLDKDTVSILATSYSQSHLLERGVFLVDQIDRIKDRKVMKVMRCVIFVRPTRASLAAVAEEVKAARYSSYTLGFSNVLPIDALNAIAGADTAELVTRVEEYFADFVALNSDLIVMPMAGTTLRDPVPLAAEAANHSYITRVAQGLTATFLAFRRKPLIRVQNSSPFAKALSAQVAGLIKSDTELFDYRAKDTVMLILDRADDPVTPLLTQWTYQAMLHDLVGLDNNRLNLPGAEEGYVFSPVDDKFFAANMFSDWGEICQNVRAHVEHYRTTVNVDRGSASLEELKNLVANLPQAKMLSNNVTKHTATVSHLAKVIKARRLLEISLLEQHMTAENSEKDHWARILEFDSDPNVLKADIARLCLIYNLRYEKVAVGSKAEQLLATTEFSSHVRQLRQYFGARNPSTLFNSGVIKSVVSLIKGFKDEQNIYTQHEPLLKRTLAAMAQGKLDETQFPYPIAAPSNPAFRPKEIIVCMVGGVTYEEAALVSKINNDPSIAGPIKVVLCAPVVHNTWSFLQSIDPSVPITLPEVAPPTASSKPAGAAAA